MKFSNIVSEAEFARISELTPPPAIAPAVPGTAPAANPAAAATGDPQAQAKMIAQQALDRANRKKQIQDQIRSTQEQLAALQKELATLR
jgi:hypothetical protein